MGSPKRRTTRARMLIGHLHMSLYRWSPEDVHISPSKRIYSMPYWAFSSSSAFGDLPKNPSHLYLSSTFKTGRNPITRAGWALGSGAAIKHLKCMSQPTRMCRSSFSPSVASLHLALSHYPLIYMCVHSTSKFNPASSLYKRSRRPLLSSNRMIWCTMERVFCLVRSTTRDGFVGVSYGSSTPVKPLILPARAAA